MQEYLRVRESKNSNALCDRDMIPYGEISRVLEMSLLTILPRSVIPDSPTIPDSWYFPS